jgi:hypothetical protein
MVQVETDSRCLWPALTTWLTWLRIETLFCVYTYLQAALMASHSSITHTCTYIPVHIHTYIFIYAHTYLQAALMDWLKLLTFIDHIRNFASKFFLAPYA